MSRIIAILCLGLAAKVASAQGFYVGMNGSYGLGAGTEAIATNMVFLPPQQSSEGVYGSFGEGFKFGVSGAYMFSNYFGTELGVSYWLGRSIDYHWQSTVSTGNGSWSGKGFVAVPSLVVTPNLKPVNPYGRFGVVLGLLTSTQELSSMVSIGKLENTYEETGGLSIGFAGALGVIVPTGGVVDFFAEVVLHSITFSPSEVKRTKYVLNGQDLLSTIQNPTFEFKDSYTSNDKNVTLGMRRPFSSIGFSVGARIAL